MENYNTLTCVGVLDLGDEPFCWTNSAMRGPADCPVSDTFNSLASVSLDSCGMFCNILGLYWV